MLHFIVNVKSGKGNALKSIKKITGYCAQNSIDYALHITKAQGDGANIARELSLVPDTTIVAVGGDGTFHEVLNGIENFDNVTVGFIPCGRGNDFARAAGFKKKPIAALLDIVRGKTKLIDYIEVGSKRCLNVAGTGMDVDVLLRVDGSSNKLTYLKSLIACLHKFKPYEIDVTLNGQTKSYKCLVAGVCNGIAFGGNMKICPEAKIDDGLMNLVIVTVPDVSVWKLLPKFLRGKHLGESWTVHEKCEEIKIVSKNLPVQLDGEIYEGLPFECKIVKGGLKTFEIE